MLGATTKQSHPPLLERNSDTNGMGRVDTNSFGLVAQWDAMNKEVIADEDAQGQQGPQVIRLRFILIEARNFKPSLTRHPAYPGRVFISFLWGYAKNTLEELFKKRDQKTIYQFLVPVACQATYPAQNKIFFGRPTACHVGATLRSWALHPC